MVFACGRNRTVTIRAHGQFPSALALLLHAREFRQRRIDRREPCNKVHGWRHFSAVTAMSPLQYQESIRLQEARVRLIREANNVQAEAFDLGYETPSQFCREYRRLFRVPPGEDMRRMRTDPNSLAEFGAESVFDGTRRT